MPNVIIGPASALTASSIFSTTRSASSPSISGQSDLDVTQERNVLIIKGGKAQKQEGEYLHRGIGGQSFECRFEHADHVRVETASFSGGLLRIVLKKANRVSVGKFFGSVFTASRLLEL